MAKKLDDLMATLPKDRKERVEDRAMELATLKDLRHAAQQTHRRLLDSYVEAQGAAKSKEKHAVR